jgi:ubiquinone/menaquinone biosynthesis C-methylase UbiE
MATGIKFEEPLLEALEDHRTAPAAEIKAERVLGLLHPESGERILDVGCGGGWLARRLAPVVQPDGQVVAIDRSQAAIDLAIKRSADLLPTAVRFKCANAHSLPFADGEFDAAVCISVLAFCEKPERVLSEIRRVLRPGGRLVVSSGDEDTRIFNARDRERGRRIERAIANRTCDPWTGRRLAPTLVRSGFGLVQENVAADVERAFEPGCASYMLAHSLHDHLITSANIAVDDYEGWLADLRSAASEGSYCYAAMTFICLAERD